MSHHVAVIGSGPAGLMAAEALASAGCRVSIWEKRKGPAWKLYIAGGSGLNITHNLPLDAFAAHYTGPQDFWLSCLGAFDPQAWLAFIEKEIGIGTFLGTSQRYFVETMHAAKLVRAWRRRLESRGVRFMLDHPCTDFTPREDGRWNLWRDGQLAEDSLSFDALCFCLGGGSYETEPLRWPALFSSKGIACEEILPSNTGYEVDWPLPFLKETEGQPLKNISLRSSRGERRGDLMITAYGLEGTPIYFLGEVGEVTIDLKPDLSLEAVIKKLGQSKENFSPLRRAQKQLGLCPAAKALLFHCADAEMKQDLSMMAAGIKEFRLRLKQPRPLSESISSRGGIAWSMLDQKLMFKSLPGVFAAGEMIAWDAPTGGFLIQACVSQGRWAAQGILSYLSTRAE